MLLVVCLGARVFTGSYVGRVGGRLVCYWHRVLLVPVCPQRVRERVAIVYSSFIGRMGGGYRRLVFFGLRLHKVIGAQCTNGRLHDMGRFEQLTCSPR